MPRSTALVLCSAFLLAAPAGAAPPKATSGAKTAPSQERAEAAFQDFARDWMAKVHRAEARERKSPKVAAGPGSMLFTYRGYGEDFRTELRPTGQAVAPFVGLLHYTEQVYSCKSLESRDCTVAATVPVTEIFRLQGDRWSY